MSIRIITDSASDITQAEAKEMNITVIPLKTIFGDLEYLDGVTLDHITFYHKLIEGDVLPTTSQISPFDHEERFREAVANKCLVQSLKSLCFAIGGTHIAGWVEEAERAAREGKVVKYE